MESRSGKKLPNLPKSESEFWDGEVNLKEIKPDTCDHYFEFFDREIKCVRCGIGYYVSASDDIKDGHLYHNGKLIV